MQSNNVAMVESMVAEALAVATVDAEQGEALLGEAEDVARKALHYSSSGQSGPELAYAYESLNEKERAVLKLLCAYYANEEGVTLSAIAAMFSMQFGAGVTLSKSGKKVDRANSWARNCMRRLVRAGFAEKVDAGTYQVTEAGYERNKTACKAPKRTKTLPAKFDATAEFGKLLASAGL